MKEQLTNCRAADPGVFGEPTLALLERHWAQLPNEVRVASDRDGWKIHFRHKESVFSQLGFKHGDRISSADLLGWSSDTGSKDLVERWLALFEHLKMD